MSSTVSGYPNLHGKADFIPSRVNTEWIQADKPGVYRGQCAEFCGLQHAHMIIYVVAESPENFRNLVSDRQLQSALQPVPILLRNTVNRCS